MVQLRASQAARASQRAVGGWRMAIGPLPRQLDDGGCDWVYRALDGATSAVTAPQGWPGNNKRQRQSLIILSSASTTYHFSLDFPMATLGIA